MVFLRHLIEDLVGGEVGGFVSTVGVRVIGQLKLQIRAREWRPRIGGTNLTTMSINEKAGEAAAITQLALQQILRWAHRPAGRQVLLGPKSADVTITEIWLLDAVFNAPVPAATLALWQAVDKSTITSQVNQLASRGLVARLPDPSDGRATLITMTPKGRRLQSHLSAYGAPGPSTR